MVAPVSTIWAAEPHTLVKHAILKRYLQAWLPIIDRSFRSLIYFDGFCGPGRYSEGEPGSPIIALEEARNHSAKLTGDVKFLFNDVRQDRVDNLRSEIGEISVPSNFFISAEKTDFATNLQSVLSFYSPSKQPPTFALVDPFGFTGIPFKLISELMSRRACECLITFMIRDINRFLTHPVDEIRAGIEETFGTQAGIPIALADSPNRIGALRDLYQCQLETIAAYTRHFEMRDQANQIIYFLFFISNHRSGYIKMKEAMWNVAPQGAFRFSDATDPAQSVLFSTGDLWLPEAVNYVISEFSGRKNVTAREVKVYVEDKTPFLKKHMNAALKELESTDRITVEKLKADRSKRHGKSFPDGVIINFEEVAH